MANEKLIARDDQRRFMLVYHDFFDSDLLDYYEKMVFMCLKKYADTTTKQAFPSLTTISRITGISKRKVQNCLKHMEELNVIQCIRRTKDTGEKQSNLYVVRDYASLWTGGQVQDDMEPDEEKQIIERLEQRGYIVTKKKDSEKESPTIPKQSHQIIKLSNQNNTQEEEKSQVIERYPEDWINEFYDLDYLKNENSTKVAEIETVANILYTTLNSTKETIRVNGENKPTMTVIGRLLKLNQETIIYAIDQFIKQTDKIKNPRAYMITCLYNAQEQYQLALRNQVTHDMAQWNNEET